MTIEQATTENTQLRELLDTERTANRKLTAENTSLKAELEREKLYSKRMGEHYVRLNDSYEDLISRVRDLIKTK